ncbi:hypothetical protein MANY_11080 [Mycolicibacterium anyangense]|uniref:Diacylglycerol O-acyltransferase n=1 Tax=Mycolicibacterium anyangense TaxID=1431246 RepID=A0A6N4W915_9MYCO|nr:hypothetical protein MANY_11080 [Mycolicibacterium anyangense]
MAGVSDNVVPYTDQALFLALRGTGEEAAMQIVWTYEHPVDIDGLRRFHAEFGQGLVARHIEPSPVPFGRHRWVAATGPQCDIDMDDSVRPRAELLDWVNEHLQLPIDPQRGPGWRMGVQRFDDGATAVSLVATHCVADGGGFIGRAIDTINGKSRDLGYPRAGSRTRRQAVAADLRQTARDLPEIIRTLGRAAKVGVARRHELVRPKTAQPAVTGGKHRVQVPNVAVYIDAKGWDARAESLGGNSYSLLAGFCAKLAEHQGRVRAADGVVTLMIPVSEREGDDDTGGNVVSIANVSFDPTQVTKDLSGPRAAIRQGLKTAREVPDEMVQLLPLIPFLPKRAFAKTVDMTFGFSEDLPVSCSNLGDLSASLLSVDGTPAEYINLRGVDRYITDEALQRRCGVLTLVSGRVGDQVTIAVVAWQPGLENTTARLRDVVAQTLAEFELTGVIE